MRNKTIENNTVNKKETQTNAQTQKQIKSNNNKKTGQ